VVAGDRRLHALQDLLLLGVELGLGEDARVEELLELLELPRRRSRLR
jgi:hypothetical protein